MNECLKKIKESIYPQSTCGDTCGDARIILAKNVFSEKHTNNARLLRQQVKLFSLCGWVFYRFS